MNVVRLYIVFQVSPPSPPPPPPKKKKKKRLDTDYNYLMWTAPLLNLVPVNKMLLIHIISQATVHITRQCGFTRSATAFVALVDFTFHCGSPHGRKCYIIYSTLPFTPAPPSVCMYTVHNLKGRLATVLISCTRPRCLTGARSVYTRTKLIKGQDTHPQTCHTPPDNED